MHDHTRVDRDTGVRLFCYLIEPPQGAIAHPEICTMLMLCLPACGTTAAAVAAAAAPATPADPQVAQVFEIEYSLGKNLTRCSEAHAGALRVHAAAVEQEGPSYAAQKQLLDSLTTCMRRAAITTAVHIMRCTQVGRWRCAARPS